METLPLCIPKYNIPFPSTECKKYIAFGLHMNFIYMVKLSHLNRKAQIMGL